MGNETSAYQNNIKDKICNYSWSKSLELIKRTGSSRIFFANLYARSVKFGGRVVVV